MVSDLVPTTDNRIRLVTYGRGLWERQFEAVGGLPIVLKSFDAWATEKGNQLKWEISNQKDVARYEVEYSTDGITFTKIGSVSPKSGDLITYEYFHNIISEQDAFYRIKTVDLDGQFNYSEVEVVKGEKKVYQLTAFPNPTSGNFRVKIPAGYSGMQSLQIYDNTGKLLLLKKIEAMVTEMPVDISRFPKGTYQVVVEGTSTRWNTRIIKR